MKIKETYEQIKAWYELQDPAKLAIIYSGGNYYSDNIESLLLQQISFYQEIKKLSARNQQFIFGEREVTLSNIAEPILEVVQRMEDNFEKQKGDYSPTELEEFEAEEWGGDYDSAGHFTPRAIDKIRRFWETLNPQKVLAIANETTMDDYEIDLWGYRASSLEISLVEPLIFSYLCYVLKMEVGEIQNLTIDSFLYILHPIYLPSPNEIEDLYQKKCEKLRSDKENEFKRSITNVINNFQNDSDFSERLAVLKSL